MRLLVFMALLATPVLGQGIQFPQAAPPRPEGALDCAILPARVIEIAQPIAGILSEVNVRPGERVAEGDVIARVDTDILRAELAQAELRAAATATLEAARARSEVAERLYDSARRAFEGGVISAAAHEEALRDRLTARFDLEREREAAGLAEAQAQALRIQIAKAAIRAPASGVIGEGLLAPGETAAGQPVATLIQVAPVRIEVFVPVTQLQSLREAPDQVIRAGDDGDLSARVTLEYISPIADQGSRTVRAYYTTEDENIVPGYRCMLVP
ncbi:efflux RND transporter periplasmic adaptor subunit [Roseobacter sp. HKCCA0434]|uniref:efflux RND transporter periplasmic adaptor subunit n=1 Tax=Roseobacter sp. HKCCA0434 TaxID=3079297 RepID=UPI00290586C1|nr:efflux RND transporter periplasmic adaptor subunit [Roseobacter sp. HKCCA0434]